MSDEDNSSCTLSDEVDAGSNQSVEVGAGSNQSVEVDAGSNQNDEVDVGSNQNDDVDSIYGESPGDLIPMTASERERLLVTALFGLMAGSQGRLNYDLLAEGFPGRTSADIRGEMDRIFRDHSPRSLDEIEGQGSMASRRGISALQMVLELEERTSMLIDVIRHQIRSITHDDLRDDWMGFGQLNLQEANVDERSNDSGFEGFTRDDWGDRSDLPPYEN